MNQKIGEKILGIALLALFALFVVTGVEGGIFAVLLMVVIMAPCLRGGMLLLQENREAAVCGKLGSVLMGYGGFVLFIGVLMAATGAILDALPTAGVAALVGYAGVRLKSPALTSEPEQKQPAAPEQKPAQKNPAPEQPAAPEKPAPEPKPAQRQTAAKPVPAPQPQWVGDFLIESGRLKKYRGSAAEVTIPNGVTRIAPRAFMGCTSLKQVILPPGMEEIGEGAFEGCSSLTRIDIPDTVRHIGADAFKGCGVGVVDDDLLP